MRNHVKTVLFAACTSLACLAMPSMGDPRPAVAPSSPAIQPATTAVPCCILPADTLVEIALSEPLTSQHAVRGASFNLQLAAPVKVGDTMVLPAGTPGQGEVIDAKSSSIGGAPGRLILAARFLTFNGIRIPLHGMKLGGAGKNQSTLSAGLSPVLGIGAMFIHGREIGYPAGTLAMAKIGGDITLSPIPPSQPAAVPVATSSSTVPTNPPTQE